MSRHLISNETPEVNPPLYFGDFEVLDMVGRGGMASVVRARSPQGCGLPPVVALKFLHQYLLQNVDMADAFQHEGALGLRCKHPGFCTTYSYEVAGGRPAIVMEYLEGHSLAHVQASLSACRSEPETQVAIAHMMACVSRAIHALHEMKDEFGGPLGAVHRDVTPQNILVTSSGQVKVIDLGVTFSSDRTVRTATGLIKGKLGYLPPEYLLGYAWDRRLDVWSIGVILWELLTGNRLFERQQMTHSILAITRAPIPPPSSLRPMVPQAFDRIVSRALARNVQDRYSTAAELAAELEAVVADVAPDFELRSWLRTLSWGPESGVMPVAPSAPPRAAFAEKETVRPGAFPTK